MIGWGNSCSLRNALNVEYIGKIILEAMNSTSIGFEDPKSDWWRDNYPPHSTYVGHALYEIKFKTEK